MGCSLTDRLNRMLKAKLDNKTRLQNFLPGFQVTN